jgi:hypothetical protein
MRRWLLLSIAAVALVIGVYGVLRTRQPGLQDPPITRTALGPPARDVPDAGIVRKLAAKSTPAQAGGQTGAAAAGAHPLAGQAPHPEPSISSLPDARLYAEPERWRKTPMPCWGLRGTAPEDFSVAVDSSFHTAGKSSASIESIRDTSGWGTLYQFADARELRGHRVEFSADLRTAVVQRGANLFVRADDAEGKALAMDNMWLSYTEEWRDDRLVNRAIVGDTDWNTYRIVLDIPVDAAVISYGVALDGAGKVWIDNALMEQVGTDVPTTAMLRPASQLESTGTFKPINLQTTPANLRFEVETASANCE